jgi:uncharacterized protein (DUF433 family)
MPFERISADTKIMAGVPCIRGTRIPVATAVGMVAEGMAVEEILADYPQLSAEDVREALKFAAAAVDERTLSRAELQCTAERHPAASTRTASRAARSCRP